MFLKPIKKNPSGRGATTTTSSSSCKTLNTLRFTPYFSCGVSNLVNRHNKTVRVASDTNSNATFHVNRSVTVLHNSFPLLILKAF